MWVLILVALCFANGDALRKSDDSTTHIELGRLFELCDKKKNVHLLPPSSPSSIIITTSIGIKNSSTWIDTSINNVISSMHRVKWEQCWTIAVRKQQKRETQFLTPSFHRVVDIIHLIFILLHAYAYGIVLIQHTNLVVSSSAVSIRRQKPVGVDFLLSVAIWILLLLQQLRTCSPCCIDNYPLFLEYKNSSRYKNIWKQWMLIHFLSNFAPHFFCPPSLFDHPTRIIHPKYWRQCPITTNQFSISPGRLAHVAPFCWRWRKLGNMIKCISTRWTLRLVRTRPQSTRRWTHFKPFPH